MEGGDGGGGLELVERGEGGMNQITLGSGSWPKPSNPRTSKFSHSNPHPGTPTTANKNKADTGRPNSSFDAFKNPFLACGDKGGSKKNKKNQQRSAKAEEHVRNSKG